MENDKLVRLSDVERWILTESACLDTQADRDAVVKRMRCSIPAVDAVEVRHGHWTKMLDRKFINTNRHEEQLQKEVLGYGGRVIENLRCSVCRKVTMVDNSILYSFCPHCGARMDGRREDGDA